MSFEELYDSCFRNISLLKQLPQKTKEEVPSSTTLDHVMSTSNYIAFLLTSSSRGSDVAQRLQTMAQKRNEKTKDKPQNSPARLRRLFSLKKKKRKETGESTTVSVVLLDTDHKSNEASILKLAHPGWFIYSPQQALITKSRLLRALGFEFPPSIIVVDSLSRTVVTTEGRRLLVDDPFGSNFPWWPPSESELLKGPIVRRVDGKTETSDYSSIKTTVKGLFFGAFWCPPCRQWLKQLVPIYNKLMSNNISLEIIFCSSDRSQDFFDQFMDQMPWSAFAYDPSKTLALTRLFNISGIPSLILLDEHNQVISRHGRSTILSDPTGSLFPWGSRPLYELNEFSVCRLRDEPSMILFTEGSPEDIQFSLSVLEQISQKLFAERQKVEETRREEREKRAEERENSENGNSISKSSSSDECSSHGSVSVHVIPSQADPLQIFYTGEDPICDHILEKILGLADAELPLICIVDGLAGQMAICDQPDVSEEVIDSFVNDYRAAKLEWTALPEAKDGGKTVAGIPASMIEQALMANSPSQTSIGNENDPKNV